MELFGWLAGTAFIWGPILIFGQAFFTVRQQTVAIIERFGRFSRVARPGLNLKIPFFETISTRLSLRVQQINVEVETKTKDNVFVHVIVSVQYYVLEDRVYEAAYKLFDPELQIRSYVFDVVRAKVPQITLDNVFEAKDDIADAVIAQLKEDMDEFGYGIQKTLVTDIDPDSKVKASMNEINAATRMRIAATEQGEADKILKVKAAEADAESKALSGKGIADQRKAIIEGLRTSMEEFQARIPDSNHQEIMNLVLMTQYFDTIKDLGHTGKTNTIMIPHSPGGMNDLMNQFRQAIITGNLLSDDNK